MKILLVTNHVAGNDGWSRYAMNLRDALVARGHTVIVETPPKPLTFLTRPWRSYFLSRKLKRIMRDAACDVLHIAVEPYALAVFFLPKAIVEKTILTVHGNYGIRPFRLRMTRWIMQRAFSRIPRFITVSIYTKKAVIKELQRLGKTTLAQRFDSHATVIHNGIPLPLRERRTLEPHTKKHILHVGGVKPAKGVGEAIEACALYKKTYGTPFHLTIIGAFWRDHYVQGLELLIHEKNLKDCVSFRGQISDAELVEEYRKADLLLVPSVTVDTTFEGFGLVYLEANAFGIPAIGPHISGAAEAIKDGVSGYQIDVFRPEMIAMRLHWILDEGKIKAEDCRKWAEEHSMKNVAEEVERLYSASC